MAFAGGTAAQSIEVGPFTVAIVEGPETELCELVLHAIEIVDEASLGRCVPTEHWPFEFRDYRRPYNFLNWEFIRDELPQEVTVPDWQQRDLSDPHWRAEAMFAYAVYNLRNGENWVADRVSDQAVREMVEQYIEDGTLPYKDGRDHRNEIEFPPNTKFWQAEVNFRGSYQTVNRLDTYRSDRYICTPRLSYYEDDTLQFIEPGIRTRGLITTGNADFVFFDDKVYYLRTPKRYLVFDELLPTQPSDLTGGNDKKIACIIEILEPSS